MDMLGKLKILLTNKFEIYFRQIAFRNEVDYITEVNTVHIKCVCMCVHVNLCKAVHLNAIKGSTLYRIT